MWNARTEETTATRGRRFVIEHESGPATVDEVIRGWRSDAAFRSLFNSLLADAPYTAFRWELPAITTATRSNTFEFVLLDSPGLARRPDPDAFAEHFTDDKVVVFANHGRDATMIVLCPMADATSYGHLAAFVRNAPNEQRDGLWQTLGEEITRRIGTRPIWLSTAGAGVSWLHVRIDDRPKYYGFGPYRV